MMFMLKCPTCKHSMKYATNSKYLGKKRKKCVYCGHSFIANENIVRRI